MGLVRDDKFQEIKNHISNQIYKNFDDYINFYNVEIPYELILLINNSYSLENLKDVSASWDKKYSLL